MAHSSSGSSNSSSSDTEVHTCSKDCLKSFEALQKQYDQQCEALNKYNLEIIGYQIGLESLEARIVVHENNETVYEENIAFLKYDVQVKDISIKELKIKTKTGLGYDGQMNESELNNIHMNKSEVVHSMFNSRESDVDDNPVNDRFKTCEGFHVVPPPYTGNYMPPIPDLSFDGLDESVFMSTVRETTTSVPKTETSISKTSKDIVEKPKTVRPSAPIIEEWDTDNDNDSVFRPKSNQTKPKFTKINFVKSGQVPVNTAKQNSPRAAASISTARPVNTDAPKPNVNDALPTTYSYFKAHSPVRRPFNQKSAAKTNNIKGKINTVRFNNVTTAGPKEVVSTVEGNKDNVGNPQYALQDQGIFNSGCSRHMTGNKFYLSDYKEIDGGFVAFGGSPKGGKIIGKGKIRTRKLDFEYTECLVPSPDFKLLDESQVLLKINRLNNMYSFDLKNVVPSGGKPCERFAFKAF
ncbi:hypothetical protein Tco_1453360 [Tanacetum coccineum]